MLRDRGGGVLAMEAIERRRAALTWAAITATWFLLVLSGIVALARYAGEPGAGASPPERWPSASGLERDPNRASLVLIAHPRCPCTRASLSELSRLLAQVAEKPAVHVLFVIPDGAEAGWHDTDLWRRASEIPGATRELDEGGRRAASFGAHTSGETLLYDREGRLSFHGGITPARGHEGDNVGVARIIALLTGGSSDRHDGAVFGCALMNDVSRF
jgi:hypothetical protein